MKWACYLLPLGIGRGLPTGTQTPTHTLTHQYLGPCTQGYGYHAWVQGYRPLVVYPRVYSSITSISTTIIYVHSSLYIYLSIVVSTSPPLLYWHHSHHCHHHRCHLTVALAMRVASTSMLHCGHLIIVIIWPLCRSCLVVVVVISLWHWPCELCQCHHVVIGSQPPQCHLCGHCDRAALLSSSSLSHCGIGHVSHVDVRLWPPPCCCCHQSCRRQVAATSMLLLSLCGTGHASWLCHHGAGVDLVVIVIVVAVALPWSWHHCCLFHAGVIAVSIVVHAQVQVALSSSHRHRRRCWCWWHCCCCHASFIMVMAMSWLWLHGCHCIIDAGRGCRINQAGHHQVAIIVVDISSDGYGGNQDSRGSDTSERLDGGGMECGGGGCGRVNSSGGSSSNR